MTATQAVWIAEYSPSLLSNAGSGGFDWSYDRTDAFSEFQRNLTVLRDTHDHAFYRVLLPADWDRENIQAWCEDHINCIPEVSKDYDPTARRSPSGTLLSEAPAEDEPEPTATTSP